MKRYLLISILMLCIGFSAARFWNPISAHAAPAQRYKVEFLNISVGTQEIEQFLNDKGSQGWYLVQVAEGPSRHDYIFTNASVQK